MTTPRCSAWRRRCRSCSPTSSQERRGPTSSARSWPTSRWARSSWAARHCSRPWTGCASWGPDRPAPGGTASPRCCSRCSARTTPRLSRTSRTTRTESSPSRRWCGCARSRRTPASWTRPGPRRDGPWRRSTTMTGPGCGRWRSRRWPGWRSRTAIPSSRSSACAGRCPRWRRSAPSTTASSCAASRRSPSWQGATWRRPSAPSTPWPTTNAPGGASPGSSGPTDWPSWPWPRGRSNAVSSSTARASPPPDRAPCRGSSWTSSSRPGCSSASRALWSPTSSTTSPPMPPTWPPSSSAAFPSCSRSATAASTSRSSAASCARWGSGAW